MPAHWSDLIRAPETKDDFLDIASTLSDEEWEALGREIEAEEGKSEKGTALSVFKDARGRYRWILLSSNAYRDRDGEIVSTKALAQDVARADVDRDFGPLRWWHVPGADIGDCDYNVLLGRVLVESGTFRSESIGAAIAKSQATLKASIGFRHPITEPDREGVFHNIRRFERSLVPAGRAANPFTSLIVKEGDDMTDEEKLAKLKELEDLAGTGALESVLNAVKSTHVQADGVAFKEASQGGELTPAGVASFITTDTNTTSAGAGMGTLTVDSALTFAAQAETDDTTKDDGMEYAGDLPPGALVSMIATAVAQAMTPLVQALDVTQKMSEFEGRMGGLMEEMKGFMGGARAKDDEIALLQEQQARKSLEDKATLDALKAEQTALKERQKTLDAQLAELTGEAPRAAQGYRASQSRDTAINNPDEHRLKAAQPEGIDPGFLGNLMRGTGMTGQAEELPPGW